MATTKTLEELLAESTASASTTATSDVSTSLSDTLASTTDATDTDTTSLLDALNLTGVSDTTKSTLSELLNGYTASGSVEDALAELNDILESEPEAFSSEYSQQLSDLLDQITNRESFSYDANSDASYQQYKDIYASAGNKAMMDTLGQAASLTGGYGSSYAQTAAQQTYNDYMTQLTSIIPELRSAALSEYTAEGDALNNSYSLASDAYNRDYTEHQNTYNQWATDRDYAQSAYDSAYSKDYTDYQNQLDYWYNIANQEAAQAASDKEYAYSTAMSMLQLGKMPSDDLLATAGISAADAKKIYNKYKTKKSRSSSSSSSSSGSSNNTSSSPDYSSLYNSIKAAYNSNSSSSSSLVDSVKKFASSVVGNAKSSTDEMEELEPEKKLK